RTLLYYTLFLSHIPPPPAPTLFPYTTLFRSSSTRPPHRRKQYLRSASYLNFAHIHGSRIEARSARCSVTGTHAAHSRRYCHHCRDRKSTRLNSSHVAISYAVFCLKKKKYASS